MIRNGDGYVEVTLGQMSSYYECAVPKAVLPEGKGVLQESSAAGVCDACIPEIAAALAPSSDEEGFQKPGGSK